MPKVVLDLAQSIHLAFADLNMSCKSREVEEFCPEVTGYFEALFFKDLHRQMLARKYTKCNKIIV